MKIVSWNCSGGFRNKLHLLNDIDADILIIQECENIEKIKNKDEFGIIKSYWFGNNQHKGLAIFIMNKSFDVEILNWDNFSYELFTPIRVKKEFTIIAVWALGTKNHNPSYVGQIWHYVKENMDKIANSGKCLLIGDFNSNSIWDKKRAVCNHSNLVKMLKEMEVESLYHINKNETHGEETSPTFYLYRKQEKPYHIDYAFASKELRDNHIIDFEIGNHEEWLKHSDHMPLIIDIE